MKKFFIILGLAAILIPLSSCEDITKGTNDNNDDIIYDFSPIELSISVADEEGNLLLSPEYENNIIGSPICFMEGRKAYAVNWENAQIESRYYMPHFYGALYKPVQKWNGHYWEASDEMRIFLGEFGGNETFDRTFTVEISRHKFELRVTNRLTWENKKPEIDRHYYLDGNELENPFYKLIVKAAS